MKGALANIPSDQVPLPSIPVDLMIGEALALAVSAKEHAEDLTAAGLDEALIDDLRVRAQGLAEAQAELVAIRGLRRSAAEVALEQQAIELRSDMVADGRFALRADPDAQSVIDRIQEGDGLDDLIQDLRALAVFAREHKEAFDKVGAKPTSNDSKPRRSRANWRRISRTGERAIGTRSRRSICATAWPLTFRRRSPRFGPLGRMSSGGSRAS